jgi:hypothetical protein
MIDIAADLNDEDETGLVWTFLDEARDPSLVVPGAIVVAGDADAPAVAEGVDVIEKPSGKVVHLGGSRLGVPSRNVATSLRPQR